MRGFEQGLDPVQLLLDNAILSALGLPNGQFVNIDGRNAEATTYGLLAVVGNTRYFVPWEKILMIRQVAPPVRTDP